MMSARPPAGPPARLRDRFELLAPLGSGGFGTVWEGFDMLLERYVAVKELPLGGEAAGVRDALREARATARLNHPAIVALYEVIAEDDRIYMINELVHGSTLDDVLDEGLASDQDVGRIGMALCEALAHAHAHGVVHRDVKPANVIVPAAWLDGAGGRRAQPAKLTDFGIASIVDSETGGGPHAGSSGYMSPEQEAGEPATAASDVYSAALVLFECFHGAPPGHGRTGRLARARRDLPAGLSACIDRCLEIDPLLRPELAELAAELAASLPALDDSLREYGVSAWLRARAGRRGHGRTHDHVSGASDGRTVAPSRSGADRAPWRFRLIGAAVAAAVATLTMVAVGVTPDGPPIVLTAAAVVLLPRTGWAPAACVGAAALVTIGLDGAALLLLAVSCLAAPASALAIAWSRVASGLVWGAAVFVWVASVQVAAGEAVVLSLPGGLPSPDAVRGSPAEALNAIAACATAAYAASLVLWSLAGGLATLMWWRRARLGWWSLLLVSAAAGQVAVGMWLDAPVPPLTMAAIPPTIASALLATAAATRRTGRVFRAT